MTQKYSALLACALMATGITTVRLMGQESAVSRADLSGRWELNPDLSDDARQKLESMRSSQGRASGYPRVASHGGDLVFAWTETDLSAVASAKADSGTLQVRTAVARLPSSLAQ